MIRCRLAAALRVGAAVAMLGGCVEEGPVAQLQPIPPGGLRRVIHPPVDWDLATQNLTATVYRCKPLACAATSVVAFVNRKPLARYPDPTALEHFALVDVPKNFLAYDAALEVLSDGKKHKELIRSRAGTALGRPAVLIDARQTIEGKVSYVAIDEIFAGPVMLQVSSRSDTLEAAHRNLKAFLAGTTLTDGPAA